MECIREVETLPEQIERDTHGLLVLNRHAVKAQQALNASSVASGVKRYLLRRTHSVSIVASQVPDNDLSIDRAHAAASLLS
jgi:hypothetical protein